MLEGEAMSDQKPSSDKVNRRKFLDQTARLAAGAAIGTTALSYSRILGANQRIALGHIGIGNRGRELDWIASRLKDPHNVERSEEHTSELQSRLHLVCRLLLEKKKKLKNEIYVLRYSWHQDK